MPSDLPAGVTLADIDGPIMPRCEFPGCGEEHNDDDNNGLCPDHQPEPDNEDAQEILAMIRAGHWPPLPEIKPITTVLRKLT